ncbi:MAG: hypothetical protein EBZ13_10490, partial [Planctomycetia bacterium]|nr:hypothetical protein [Planctomycetia bacterium]
MWQEVGSGSDRTAVRWAPRVVPFAPPPAPPTATRRQDVANENQLEQANFSFAWFGPKESRAGGPSFP